MFGGWSLVNVDIDNELYNEVKELVKKNKYDYPSVKFFVQKVIRKEILNSRKNIDYDNLFLKLKGALRNNPELLSKIDRLYDSEAKKLKEEVSG